MRKYLALERAHYLLLIRSFSLLVEVLQTLIARLTSCVFLISACLSLCYIAIEIIMCWRPRNEIAAILVFVEAGHPTEVKKKFQYVMTNYLTLTF